MKNILVPTTLQPDTIGAIKTAVRQSAGFPCAIVLLILCDVPSTYAAATLLYKTTPGYTTAQLTILTRCKEIVRAIPHCELQVHVQFGISGPLLKNILEYKRIGLILLTPGYKQEQQKIHRYCTALLLNSKCPILYPGHNCHGQQLGKAMYLERAKTTIGMQQIQNIISSCFSFTIVSTTKLTEKQAPEDLAPLLAETIFKNDIDLLVETRRHKKLNLMKPKTLSVNETLGLPVLSIFEGDV